VSEHLSVNERPTGIPPSAPSPYPPSDLMLRDERAALVPLSEVTIWRPEKAGKFPRRFKLGIKRVAWSRHEVLDWIAAQASVRCNVCAQSP
jgi:predicted DNA-binding transcriptional regulator AlpA